VIRTAVLCPHPPLLLRELGGEQDPAVDLRKAALAAVSEAVARASHVVVVGGHDTGGPWDASTPVDVRRLGTTGPPPSRPGLPLSLGVGMRLLDEVGWSGPTDLLAVPWDAHRAAVEEVTRGLADRPDGTVLLVMGDGSTRRGDKAPGYLDERSFPFDDDVAAALSTGDAQALADLDADLAADLMVLGATVLRVLGGLAVAQGSQPAATLSYRDDPFGVSWFVATWQLDTPACGWSRVEVVRPPGSE
jgi:hypothetical protein